MVTFPLSFQYEKKYPLCVPSWFEVMVLSASALAAAKAGMESMAATRATKTASDRSFSKAFFLMLPNIIFLTFWGWAGMDFDPSPALWRIMIGRCCLLH